jgi:hypothetical protein
VSRKPEKPAAAPVVDSAIRPRRIKLLYELLAVLLLVGVGPLAISSRKMMQINQSTLESGILAAQTQIVTSSAERVESFLGGTSATLRGMARFQGHGAPRRRAAHGPAHPVPRLYGSLLAVADAADGRQIAEVGAAQLAVDQLGSGEAPRPRRRAARGGTSAPFFRRRRTAVGSGSRCATRTTG